MTTATKSTNTYCARGVELVKAWGGDLSGPIAPDRCPSRHRPLVRCADCGNTAPRGALADTPDEAREVSWRFWYANSTYTVAPDPLDVACERAVQPTPQHRKDEQTWSDLKAKLDALDRDMAAAFTASQDTSDRRVISNDGTFYEERSRRAQEAEDRLDDLRLRRADLEVDVQRARARVGHHEAVLDQRRRVWRDAHRAEFVR
jgi:hypothetical protein